MKVWRLKSALHGPQAGRKAQGGAAGPPPGLHRCARPSTEQAAWLASSPPLAQADRRRAAVAAGDLAELKRLLAELPPERRYIFDDIDDDIDDITLFFIACFYGHLEVVRYLRALLFHLVALCLQGTSVVCPDIIARRERAAMAQVAVRQLRERDDDRRVAGRELPDVPRRRPRLDAERRWCLLRRHRRDCDRHPARPHWRRRALGEGDCAISRGRFPHDIGICDTLKTSIGRHEMRAPPWPRRQAWPLVRRACAAGQARRCGRGPPLRGRPWRLLRPRALARGRLLRRVLG
jgi:hypothetical protein